ncbi:unnamed protein product [Brassica oleracea var. botrytis]
MVLVRNCYKRSVVRTRQGDTSIKTADELSKIMAFLFEWCCQFPRTDSFSPVSVD